ncbi:uncharacterized protein RMCC_3798 [Mycolicibacterium canariasense]|uniref:Uncharacterized protein n=1 Tax=Mycolicibacterium canariasense TaxID=228230 RepID=A0A100WDY6_MYCCR|nr:hypothetical protein [Mycolicibacterium canariasense]MCV7213296.1 hypothetical protein [Mycolicibacterium canariasense]ORV05155.1 hypothetical protein AWB94_20420 [Mycolicibacterium canariasense]GAS96832.1 uncharacterized protein RMCC_3798 [Mycolicibacterium canariasense]
MTAVRGVLVLAGVGLAGYGAWLLSEQPPVILLRMLTWALAAVLIHDLVFAPLCTAVGWTGRRILPQRWWVPVAVAGLCTVVLLVLAIPVYDKPGLRPDNNTVLNRDYPRGLLISLALVWCAVPVYRFALGRLPIRQNKVVERQRTDDVDGQPPAA